MCGTTSAKCRAKKASTAFRLSSAAKLSVLPFSARNSVTVKLPSDVGQRDQHEAAARPDVQGVALDGVRSRRAAAGNVSSL